MGMCSPEGGSTPAWLTVGSAHRKIKLGFSTTLGVQEEGGSARAACPWDTPALLAPSPHPHHATSCCPQPLMSFRPTQLKSPDFACSPHMNVTPPQWTWQGGTPTQWFSCKAKDIHKKAMVGSDSPSTWLTPGQLGTPGRSRDVPDSAGC